jgi:hypothetical protein
VSWRLYWFDTPEVGRSGFVQSRLKGCTLNSEFPMLELAAIEFHAPIYYVNITRHVKGYVQAQLDGPAQCATLEEAKAYATALVRLS